MTFSCISPEDVRAKYNAAEDKNYILGVLADLTASTKYDVRIFLGISKGRLPGRKPPGTMDPVVARQLYDEGYSDSQIGDILGVARQTVGCWRRKSGLTVHNPVVTVEDNRMELYYKGMTDPDIARAVGVTQAVIWRWRTRKGLPPNGTRGGNRRKKKNAGSEMLEG